MPSMLVFMGTTYRIIQVILAFSLIFTQAAEHGSFCTKDGYALRNFLGGIENSNNLHTNWTGPQCNYNISYWKGITCLHGKVTGLHLDNMGLSGLLHHTILQNLTELRVVILKNNELFGELPDLSYLANLQYLDVSFNKFSGSIYQLCSGNTTGLKVVSVSYNRLSGSIPMCIERLSSLRVLYLEKNSFSGNLPEFELKNLVGFNVSYNNLVGRIPNTTTMNSFGHTSFLGNPGLCGEGENSSCNFNEKGNFPKAKVVMIVIITAFGTVGGLIAIVCLFLCCKRFCKGDSVGSKNIEGQALCRFSSLGCWKGDNDGSCSKSIVFFAPVEKPFDIDLVLSASAQLLGSGSLGNTYKVMISPNQAFTVKRFYKVEALRRKNFQECMVVLGRLYHMNVVPLVGYYDSKEEHLIIHNYMPFGSLHDHLFGGRGEGRIPLDWNLRLKVAFGISRGLSYLHRQFQGQKVHYHFQIPHGNLKCSNVLLRQDFEPALCDYGFSAFATSPEKLMSYKSPEYLHSKRICMKTDVWSFGILLLELLTGKQHCCTNSEDGINISKWIKSLDVGCWLYEVLDLEIGISRQREPLLTELLQVGLSCADENPENRPSVYEVMERIGGIYATNYYN